MLTTGIPSGKRILGLVNNAGHALIFGLFALIMLRLLVGRGAREFEPRVRDFIVAFAVTIATGIAVELVQARIGRDASIVDVVMDAAGAAAALSIAAACQYWHESARVRVGLIGLAVAAIAVVLTPLVEAAFAYERRQAIFPVVASFEHQLDLYFIQDAGVEIARVPLPEPWARGQRLPALRVQLARADTPGLRLEEPVSDWRGFQRLEFDLVNPGPRPLYLMIRVHDAKHDQRPADRFNLPFTLTAASRQILTIPLRDIEHAPDRRKMDLAHIAGIVIFERSRPAPVDSVFYLHQIRVQ